jgi:GTPase Era involved in 16S rRNA processing
MSKLIKVVLIGPTGAGKSQFCNFIHKDLTNSIHKVSDSLNSCTTEPKSTIVQRPNIRLELIDSPGSSDSNNDDEENLTILFKYLRNKKEINQIFLVLSFENRFTGDTKKFLSILGWIFTPIQFMTNLMIIFTHYPDKPDEDDITKFKLLEKEINEELNKIFEIPIECKIPKIPVYYINTKIFKNEGILYFDKTSEEILNKIIKELKIRVNTNNAIIKR